jgi:hypothetical protein
MMLQRRVDAIGLGSALTFAGWIVLVAIVVGGRPLPPAVLVLGVVATVLVTRWVEERWPRSVPALVAASPLIATLVLGRPFAGEGPLGYANASGALYLVGAAGAFVLAGSIERPTVRRAIYVLAGLWVLAPWALGATTAALATTLLTVAVITLRRPASMRLVLTGGAVLASVVLVSTAVLGARYDGGARSGIASRFIDEYLGESRVFLWEQAVELLRSAPVTGVGPGRFAVTDATWLSSDYTRWAHNEYLEVAAETGLVGAALLLMLVAWGFAQLLPVSTDARAVPTICALVAISTNASIDYIFHYAMVPLALAAMIGATTSSVRAPAVAMLSTMRSRTRKAVLSAVVLVGVLLSPVPFLNPLSVEENQADWSEEGDGLVFSGVGGARAIDRSAALYGRLASAGEFTVEMVVATHDTSQEGPARIVSFSEGVSRRNLTVGQDDDQLVIRVRTTRTDRNGISGQVRVPGVFATTRPKHVVITTDIETMQVFVDAVPLWDGEAPGGTLANWNRNYPFLLGHEADGRRAWSGEIHHLGLFDFRFSDVLVRRSFVPQTSQYRRSTALSPVALYTFDEGQGTIAFDRSTDRLGGDLELPRRVPTAQAGFMQTVFDRSYWSVGRTSVHAAIFAIWAAAVAAWLRQDRSGRATALVTLSLGTAVAIAGSVLRYADGRAPSLVDVLGAIVGCLSGMATVLLSGRRRSRGRVPGQ